VTITSRYLEELAHYKASEFRSFVLFYFLTLEGLLPTEYFEHFLFLSYGLQVLLQEKVHLDLVQEVQILFVDFVRRFAVLYGKENMRFNMHLLTHLSQSVIDWGCLWASLTFIPEWFNGQLVAMTNGTQFLAD